MEKGTGGGGVGGKDKGNNTYALRCRVVNRVSFKNGEKRRSRSIYSIFSDSSINRIWLNAFSSLLRLCSVYIFFFIFIRLPLILILCSFVLRTRFHSLPPPSVTDLFSARSSRARESGVGRRPGKISETLSRDYSRLSSGLYVYIRVFVCNRSFSSFFFAMEGKGKQRGSSRGELGEIREREIKCVAHLACV